MLIMHKAYKRVTVTVRSSGNLLIHEIMKNDKQIEYNLSIIESINKKI